MIDFSSITIASYEELCFLLDRGYPKKSALNFVANHYKYPKDERLVLNRVSIPRHLVERIYQNQIIDPRKLKNHVFSIDIYNQFTTFQSIQDGEPLLLCRDGIIRDIFSILHTKDDLKFQNEMIEKFLLNIFELKPQYLILYFDQQRSMSGVHSHKFQEVLDKFELPGRCIVTKAVDHFLKFQTDSIAFTHDSIILHEVQTSFDFFRWYFEIKNVKTQIINKFAKYQLGENNKRG